MKIAKKRRGLIASIALSAMVLSGCTVADGWEMTKKFVTETVWGTVLSWFGKAPQQEQKEDEKKEDTPAAVEKKDVSITIAMEDGKQYNEGEFVAPQISVNPSSLTPVVTYYQGEQAVNGTPQTVGDYKIVAKTEENEEYNAGLASKSFLIRKVPTITFFYGNDNPLEADHQFDLAHGDYNIYAKSSVEGANFTYSYLDQEGTAINGKPNQPGTYYFVASVERTNTIGNTSKSIRFNLVDSSSGVVAVDPVIKFFYNDQEACLESNWLIGGYGDSQFFDNEFDITKLSYTVEPEEATYVESWTLNDQPISKPTANPLAAGTYALTITVEETEVAHAATKWAGFVIKSSEKTDPVIQFFYDGVEKCLTSNWLNEGYGDSQFYADEFDVTKLTYSVTPSVPAEVSWTVNDAPIAAPSNPLAPGTYAMTVNVPETDTVNEGVKWALFEIKDSSSTKVDPVIQFFYDGVEKCTENNWLDGGYGVSQYYAEDFDIAKLTYTVTPEATADVTWTLNDNPINAPTNPLAAGTYAMTVTVAASDTINAGSKWAGFVIKESAPSKAEPTIQFFYDGVEKCTENNWLDGGYGVSQYFASAFDVTKLTYTVTPEATAEVSWTLNDAPIAAPSNPLAPGTYAMTVTVTESETVQAGVKWAGFVIKADKTDPTIKFFYDGAEKCTENNWLDGGYGVSQYYANEFDVTKLTYTVTPELEATVSWTLNDAPIAAPTNPLAAGTYAMTVSVAEGDENNAASKWAGFVIKESAPEKVDPQIQFFYDGAEKCISGTRWLNEGFGDSQFRASEFDLSKLTYTVTPEANATVSWALNDAPIAAPSAPLAVGTYSMTVTVEASDTVNAGSAYALFAIKADKADPVIKFFYDGAEKCISGTRWLNEGAGDSQFYSNEFDISKLTYTVTPELPATVSWTLSDTPIAAPTNPLAAGTYAMTVSVAEGDENNAASLWALFIINEPAAPTPGSAELPYTVAQARAAIDANEGVTDVYVTGIVTSIPFAYSTSNKNMSFFFSDDGTKTNEIEAYKLSADTDPNVEVGDFVVVKGNLTKYNSTYELNTGCTLTSLTKATVESITISGTATQTEYSVNSAYNHNGLKATAHLNSGVDKDISNDATWTINPATAALGHTSISITATYEGVVSNAFEVNVTVSEGPVSIQPYSQNFGSTGYKNSSNSSYTGVYDVTLDGISWKIPGNQSLDSGLKLGGKLSAETTRSIISQTAFDNPISSVSVKTGTKDTQITVTKCALKVYSSATDALNGTNCVEEVVATYVDNGTITFEKPAASDWEGIYFTLSFSMTSSASSKNCGIIISNITVNF